MKGRISNKISDLSHQLFGSQIWSFISDYITDELLINGGYSIIKSKDDLQIIEDSPSYNVIICGIPMNDFLDINESLSKIHNSLKSKGIYIGLVETLEGRKRRLANLSNTYLYKMIVIYELIFKRVFPKLSGFRLLYRKFRILRFHILSRCEALGRLRYCGFEILDLKETDRYLYFVVHKGLNPSQESPHDGLLVKIPKIGKDGRIIYCYKLRTMHAYANYLNDYILKNHSIDNEGKIIEDYRKTEWGKFMRRFWIDEIPQIINVLRGDLSLVGLRPLSKEFLSLYPKEWRDERLKIKPGFVPPYYAHCPKTFDDIIESEKKYYESKKRHPVRTDLRYFFVVLWNFLSGRARTG